MGKVLLLKKDRQHARTQWKEEYYNSARKQQQQQREVKQKMCIRQTHTTFSSFSLSLSFVRHVVVVFSDERTNERTRLLFPIEE